MKKSLIKVFQIFLGKEQLKDTLYLTIANSVARAIGFIMPFILIKLSGIEVYGKFTFILNTLATIIAIFSSGLTNVVSRYLINKEDKIDQNVFDELLIKSIRLILFVIGGALLFFVFGYLLFPELLLMQKELLLGLGYVCFTLMGSFVIGFHYVKQNYLKISSAIFVSSFVQLVLLVPAIQFLGLLGIILVYVLFSLIQLGMLVRNEEHFKWQIIVESFKRYSSRNAPQNDLFIKFVLPIILASVAVPISLWYANHQIAIFFGFSDLGFINIAIQMQVIIAFLPTIFNSMAIPILSKTFKEDKKSFFSYLKGFSLKTISSSGIIFILIFIFAKQILMIYSPSYAEYYDILRVFSVSFFLSVILNIVGIVILSIASMWWGTILNIIWALSFIASILLFVPIYGLMGFAYSYLLSYSLHFFSVMIYTFYFIRKNS